MATKAFQILLDELGEHQGKLSRAEAWREQCQETLDNAERVLAQARTELEEIEAAMRLIDPASAEIFVEAVKEDAS